MSLKYRIAATIFVLEAVLLGFVLWNTQTLLQARHAEQTRAQEQVMLDLLGEMSRIALLRMDYSEIQAYVEEAVRDPRVVRVVLVDDRGRVVASSEPAEFGSVLRSFEATDEHSFRSLDISNAAGSLGRLAISFSDAAEREVTREARNQGVLIAAVGMSFIALVGLAMGTLLTRRLDLLKTTAGRLASGELDARVELGGRDEVTQVGRAFDHMAERIANMIAELETRQTEVEAKNAELQRLTYAVSHDLKNPLFTIQGFLGMVEKDAARHDLDAVLKDTGQIRRAASHMRRLLDEILQLSEIQRKSATFEIIALSDLTKRAMETLAGEIRERGVTVEVAADLPRVLGHRHQLFDVFRHLLENAIKYMGPQSVPKVEIGHREDENLVARQDSGAEPHETVIFVRDNGIGIDPRYHHQIFGLFNRLQTDGEGTGIGLALVARVIEVHGGRIWVESEGLGLGSTFCFTLPDVGS